MILGVVAHADRRVLAERLIGEVDADLWRFDQTHPPTPAGCANNHIEVLKHLKDIATPSEWCIVLEDDARPVENFWVEVKRALLLCHRRTPLVGLYLGTGNPDGVTQQAIMPAIERADEYDAAWIVSDWFISTVGYVVRSEWISSLITAISDMTGPVDNRINDWTQQIGIDTWYTVPSLVDHDDQSSMLTTFMPHKRHAHRFGTRDTWNNKRVRMGYAKGWSPDA